MAVKTSTFVGNEIESLGEGPIVVVAVVRKRREDLLELGSFLVDTGCLGVKNAWFEVFRDAESLDRMLGKMFFDGYLEKNGPWGRGFVEAAVKYAGSLGFAPHRDYKKAARVFGGTDAKDCGEKFVFGLAGKPYYCQGPKDSDKTASKIVSILSKRCGEGGFTFILAPSEKVERTGEEVDLLLALAEEGRVDESLAGLEALYAEHPGSVPVVFGLGVWHLINEESGMALPWLEKAVELDPECAEAWFNKGMVHKELGVDENDARHIGLMLEAFQQALQHWGEDENDTLKVAREIVQAFTQEAEDCGISLDTYIESCMVFAEGVDRMDEGKWEAALEKMGESVELNPKSHQAHGNMGLCLLNLKRIDEAREKLQTALGISPGYAPAKHNLKAIEGYDDEHLPPIHETVIYDVARANMMKLPGEEEQLIS